MRRKVEGLLTAVTADICDKVFSCNCDRCGCTGSRDHGKGEWGDLIGVVAEEEVVSVYAEEDVARNLGVKGRVNFMREHKVLAVG